MFITLGLKIFVFCKKWLIIRETNKDRKNNAAMMVMVKNRLEYYQNDKERLQESARNK